MLTINRISPGAFLQKSTTHSATNHICETLPASVEKVRPVKNCRNQ